MKTLLDEILQTTQSVPAYEAKDFKPDVDVRWCAGCGAFSVLSPVQRFLPNLNLPKEKIVFISGIGCSGRFSYYVDTYGFHSIHGRPIAIATGLKIARPDLSVWIATGDGDCMSIGGNHMIHAARRNTDLNIMLFNNEVYSLTKGQASPTSHPGQITKSSPLGSLEDAFNPASLALGSGAPFVARGIDKDRQMMQDLFEKAAKHKGFAFMEIYTNCVIFNDGAFEEYTRKGIREDHTLMLEHGKPMLFGKEMDKGVRLDGYTPVVVNLRDGEYSENDVLVHNEKDSTLAFILANMTYHESLPRPIGVFLDLERPSYESRVEAQINAEIEKYGEPDFDGLLKGKSFWTV
ncbi:MAG: 2-oxoacid:ferredoxin oxidoreductase subunit beta [Cyclobacteriaceae bacterium]|nr:2-oxoacid:ferredoxin oxidoreductase subunit beta [Cyclobacteriaceae bacterium]